ncbi:hypothetical protein GCM10022392_22790 [Mucilaginibacter panaciglaebae]|uniref:Uncharacterized protein n=1 Tax=Mucilaginibacter panaciglaebae TaxID=502331 RepID=A0ABP7WWY6_9SPHI
MPKLASCYKNKDLKIKADAYHPIISITHITGKIIVTYLQKITYLYNLTGCKMPRV